MDKKLNWVSTTLKTLRNSECTRGVPGLNVDINADSTMCTSSKEEGEEDSYSNSSCFVIHPSLLCFIRSTNF
jgi:hypothetical protein